MHIMQYTYMNNYISHQQLTSSIVTLLTGVPENNMRHIEAFQTQKQEQYTQEY